MLANLAALVTFIGSLVYIAPKLLYIARSARAIYRQLMVWDEQGRQEDQRLLAAARLRRRYLRHPWERIADAHDRRAAAIRAELQALYRRAALRARYPLPPRPPRRRPPNPPPGQ